MLDMNDYSRHLHYADVIRDVDTIYALNDRFCDFSVKYRKWRFRDNGATLCDTSSPIGSLAYRSMIVGVGLHKLRKNKLPNGSVLDTDAVFTSMVGFHESRHLWFNSIGYSRSSNTAAEWLKDMARTSVLSTCFPSYYRNIYLFSPIELSADHASIQGVQALYDARKRTNSKYATIDLDQIVSDKARARHGRAWPHFMACHTVKDVEAAYAEALSLSIDMSRFDKEYLQNDCRDDRKMQKLLENRDFVKQLTRVESGVEQTDMLCKYVGEHYPKYFRDVPCIADEYLFPNKKNEKELRIRELIRVHPLYDDVSLVPPTYTTEDFITQADMVFFKESAKMLAPYRATMVIPESLLRMRSVDKLRSVELELLPTVRSTVVPDIDRYVAEHGNGVTDAGITRSLRLLPALRAIGDPTGGLCLTRQDMEDIHVLLNDYKDHGELRFSDHGHMLRVDVKATTDAGREALDRLSSQCFPDGTTKALAVGQAVALSMPPSADMAHKSFWDLLGSTVGTRDMAGFTNSDVAAATVQTMLTMPPGRHAREEADKLSDNWKDLMRRAPSTVMSGNPSLYMMQFVMLQNIAALNGYDLLPDEQQGSQIGELLRKKPLDMDALRDALSDCVTPQAETAATGIGSDKTVKSDESTSVNLILRTSGKPPDQKSGPDGPDF